MNEQIMLTEQEIKMLNSLITEEVIRLSKRKMWKLSLGYSQAIMETRTFLTNLRDKIIKFSKIKYDESI